MIALWAGAAFWLRAPGTSGRTRVATGVFLALLTAVLLSTPFMPTPTSVPAFAIFALVSYVALALLAAWIDHRRRSARA